MTAQVTRPSIPRKDPDDKPEGSFHSRVSVTHGTRQPSRLKNPVGSPDAGSIHRNTATTYQQPKLDHAPYTSAHRNAEEPGDLSQLKKHQTAMISDKQKRKNRQAKSK